MYRYRGREMSGLLPTVLYKYLPLRYAQALIEEGEVMFSTLSWFKQLEDQQRGDLLEGTHVHRPENGLEVTMVHRVGDPSIAGQRRTLGRESLVSEVIGQDHIFIYSTSLQPGLNQFSSESDESGCVEIHSPANFLGRLKARLRKWPPIAKTPVIHDRVSYYAATDLPGTTYALPGCGSHTGHSASHPIRAGMTAQNRASSVFGHIARAIQSVFGEFPF